MVESRRTILAGLAAGVGIVLTAPLNVFAKGNNSKIHVFAKGNPKERELIKEYDVCGKKKQKVYRGIYTAVACAYTRCGKWGDAFTDLGVGIINEKNQGMIWGLWMPKKIITSYRGMLIADKIGRFENGDLCSCFYAGDRNSSETDSRYVQRAELKIGRGEREKVLDKVPSNMDDIILGLTSKGLSFDTNELNAELTRGVLKHSDVIDKYVKV